MIEITGRVRALYSENNLALLYYTINWFSTSFVPIEILHTLRIRACIYLFKLD